jgi:hypothetical protein
MQDQVLTHSLGVREVFEVYDPAIRQTQKIHGNADYQVSRKRTKKKNPSPGRSNFLLQQIRRCSRSTSAFAEPR